MPEGSVGRAGGADLGLQAETPRLVLASGSRARRALLEAAGMRFDVVVPDVNEADSKSATRSAGGTPAQAAQALARQKAAVVTDPDCMVIGCDQILLCEGTWFDKPATMEEARRHLLALRGREHTLVTAVVCMRGGQRLWRESAAPKLRMRNFSASFLDAYLAAEGESLLQTVGAYRLEGLGVHLFDSIEGEHSAILGLPLPRMLGFLRSSGVLKG
jgi:septum formation protein